MAENWKVSVIQQSYILMESALSTIYAWAHYITDTVVYEIASVIIRTYQGYGIVKYYSVP